MHVVLLQLLQQQQLWFILESELAKCCALAAAVHTTLFRGSDSSSCTHPFCVLSNLLHALQVHRAGHALPWMWRVLKGGFKEAAHAVKAGSTLTFGQWQERLHMQPGATGEQCPDK